MAKASSEERAAAHKAIREGIRLREIAKHGMTFQDEVVLAKEHRQAIDRVWSGGPADVERARMRDARFQAEQRAAEANAATAEAERVSPILILDSSRRSQLKAAGSGRTKEWPCRCNPVERSWNLEFQGGSALNVPIGNSVTVPQMLVEGVDGAIGWRDVPRIDNKDTNKAVASHLSFSWFRTVPRDGTFSFLISPESTFLRAHWRTKGSGLWGTDARVKITYHSWFLLGNSAVAGHDITLVDHTQSTFGHSEGDLHKWLPLGAEGMFRAVAGAAVWAFVILDIDTWSDDGRAFVDIQDFWCADIGDFNAHVALID